MKAGLAGLKNQRAILSLHFRRLVEYTMSQRRKKMKEFAKIHKVQTFTKRRMQAKVLHLIHLHSVRSKRYRIMVNTIRDKVDERILAETVMRWKIFKLQASTEQISFETADTHFARKLLRKAILAMQMN